MESARRQRDKAYRHLFKGSVLVSTLLDQDRERFASRADAVRFGQRLLDGGHIQSIVGSKEFDDSVHLYRWTDESIVEEAKKLVSTSSSHIPKRRLTELLDFQKKDAPDGGEPTSRAKRRARDDAAPSRARSQIRTATRPGASAKPSGSGGDRAKCAGKDRGSPKRCRSFDSNSGSVKENSAARRSSSVPSSNAVRGNQKKDTQHGVQRSPQAFTAELNRTNVNRPAQNNNNNTKKAKDKSRTYNQQTDGDVPVQKSAQNFKISFASQSVADLTTDKVSRSPQHTNIDFISFVDFQMTPPVSCEQKKEARHQTMAPDTTTATDKSAAKESTDCGRPRENEAPPDMDLISTCRYDGVEMPALDLENLDFDSLRPRTEKTAEESLAVMRRSVEALAEQSHGYSDNEKVLLEQMKLMRAEHEKLVDYYERKIDSLMNSINYIRDVVRCPKSGRDSIEERSMSEAKTDAEKTADQKQKNALRAANQSSRGSSQVPARETPNSLSPTSPSAADAPVPPPPPPPAPPLYPSQAPKLLRPRKPPIKPKVKMRPLFWNRIILDSKDQDEPNFWQNATEPNFDILEFEKLFGRKNDTRTKERASLHETLNPSNGLIKMQAAKILDDKRSRAVGIKMKSLHCTMDDIKHAVYNLDFSKVDIDSLQSLAEVRGTDEELNKIRQHLKEHPNVALDKPEDFLWELSKLSYFPERTKCFALKKRFSETLFNIDQQLCTVQNACTELSDSKGVRSVLEMVLAFGNYMNGGTQRGQADGFDLNILVKLKDVKAMDNSTTLLHFIVRQHCKEREENVGKKEARFPLPDQTLMISAAATSFVDLGKELQQLKQELKQYSKKAEEIYEKSENSTQQPFREQMDDFFDSAEHMLQAQQTQVDETEKKFYSLLKYLLFMTKDEVTPGTFFSMWATFLDDYKRCWKEEQRRLAREMFEKAEEKRRERMRMVKRRRSMPITDDNNNTNGINLKQKFNAMRRRSEQVHTARLFRSQSVHNMDGSKEEDWNDTRGTRSFSGYPGTGSTPSPTFLRPSDVLRQRLGANSPISPRDRDEDAAFGQAQDDVRSPERSRPLSTFQLNLKKELRPTITITNPITNATERVTLRRDPGGVQSDAGDVSSPVQDPLRARRNRTATENDAADARRLARADDKQTCATAAKSRTDREKPLTRPKSSANMDELKRITARGPMRIDYKVDFVPGKLEPSKIHPFQSTPLRHARHLRSAENLTTDADDGDGPSSASSSRSQTAAASFRGSPRRSGSVERLSVDGWTANRISAGTRPGGGDPPAKDLAPSGGDPPAKDLGPSGDVDETRQ